MCLTHTVKMWLRVRTQLRPLAAKSLCGALELDNIYSCVPIIGERRLH